MLRAFRRAFGGVAPAQMAQNELAEAERALLEA